MNIQKKCNESTKRILESVRKFTNMADYEINTQRSITHTHTHTHTHVCVCVCVYVYIKYMEQFDYLI